MNQKLKVLLIEDDWSVRNAVRDYLAKRQMVVFEADCLEAALAVADTAQPDVAVVDIVMPERAGERADFKQHVGIKVARQLREQFPKLGIVFLSAYVDRGPEVVQLFMDGHDRIIYLLKGSKPQELLNAIHKAAGGLSALEIAAGVQMAHKTTFDLALEMLTDEENECVMMALDSLQTLSESEWRVFEAVGRCRTRQQAAHELGVSTKTIGRHMDMVYDKLCLKEAHSGLNQLALLVKIYVLYRLRQMETNQES
ncbi:MAG: response regulator transcription factor [Chloroflexi bacterium]|nr:response regulator transcription factor [Chloroflexota bacterium]